MTFRETKRVLFSADLAGFARATAKLDALVGAVFLDDWYQLCAAAVRNHNGRIVKYMRRVSCHFR
ncbi:MAG: hypothetical protein JW940_31795 [Polyangiaceae bacterium]|nr:hypothetical protein [Polyangiaceae bacterium]